MNKLRRRKRKEKKNENSFVLFMRTDHPQSYLILHKMIRNCYQLNREREREREDKTKNAYLRRKPWSAPQEWYKSVLSVIKYDRQYLECFKASNQIYLCSSSSVPSFLYSPHFCCLTFTISISGKKHCH